MTNRWMVSSFTASSLIHLGLIPIAALIMHAKPIKPVTVPIELIDVPRVDEPKHTTAPKLLSKPLLETSPRPPSGNTKEAVKENPAEPAPPLASLPEKSGAANAGWNSGT